MITIKSFCCRTLRWVPVITSLAIGLVAPLTLAQTIPPSRSAATAESFLTRGLEAIQEGLLEKAIESFRMALNANPQLVPAHYNLGLALRQQGDLSGAIVAFSGAIQVDPGFALAYSNLGAALLEGDNLDEAQRYLNQAVQIDPMLSLAHYNLGLLYQKQGNPLAAQRSFQRTLQLSPNSPQAFYHLGIVYQQQAEQGASAAPLLIAQAQSAFQQAIVLEPRYAEAHYRLGSLYYSQGKYAEAIVSFRKTAESRPGEASAYYAAALAFDKLHQPADALVLFEYALGIYRRHNQQDWIDRTLQQIERLRLGL